MVAREGGHPGRGQAGPRPAGRRGRRPGRDRRGRGPGRDRRRRRARRRVAGRARRQPGDRRAPARRRHEADRASIVGHVMRETRGRADGGEVTRLVREKLGLWRPAAPSAAGACGAGVPWADPAQGGAHVASHPHGPVPATRRSPSGPPTIPRPWRPRCRRSARSSTGATSGWCRPARGRPSRSSELPVGRGARDHAPADQRRLTRPRGCRRSPSSPPSTGARASTTRRLRPRIRPRVDAVDLRARDPVPGGRDRARRLSPLALPVALAASRTPGSSPSSTPSAGPTSCGRSARARPPTRRRCRSACSATSSATTRPPRISL